MPPSQIFDLMERLFGLDSPEYLASKSRVEMIKSFLEYTTRALNGCIRENRHFVVSPVDRASVPYGWHLVGRLYLLNKDPEYVPGIVKDEKFVLSPRPVEPMGVTIAVDVEKDEAAKNAITSYFRENAERRGMSHMIYLTAAPSPETEFITLSDPEGK